MNPINFLSDLYGPLLAEAMVYRPLSVHNLIKKEETGVCSDATLDEYFTENLFRKHPDLFGLNTDDATLNDFYAAEHRATSYDLGFDVMIQGKPKLVRVLNIWRDQVQLIMGKFSYGRPMITHGATTTCARGQTPLHRFSDVECTERCSSYIASLPDEIKNLLPWDTSSVGKAKTSIVPKTASIGRLIAVPCAGNAFMQKMHGKTLSQRLMVQGINLSYAQEVHRRLAKFASMKGHLTTDDAKWASSLIYTSLVRYLLSDEWFFHLSSCRDDVLLMPDGSTHLLAQFATMGNGFCFELETIIFLAMIRTAAYIKGCSIRDKNLRVFGDDLIYPVELTDTVRKIGAAVGFITNVDKSFSEGPFRESCGYDSLNGRNIRPVFLKGNLDDCHDLTTMANLVYDLLHRYEWELPLVKRCWLKLIQRIYRLGGRSSALWGPGHMDCLVGRPVENWRFYSNKRHQQLQLKHWKKFPRQTQSFRTAVYGKDPAYVLRMVTAGYMRGYGYEHINAHSIRKGRFTCLIPHSFEYPRTIAEPGTPYVSRVVTGNYYPYPPLIDGTDPLAIFDILPMTNCRSRVYARDYNLAVVRDNILARRDLVDKLGERTGMESLMSDIVSNQDDIDIDFL